MAIRNRRMISRTISTSEKVHQISEPARLLFTWMILHCDDDGRMQGSPLTIKAIVLPLSTRTPSEIKRYLKEMDRAGLIRWYEVEKKWFVQVENWHNFQTFKGIHRDDSRIPSPPHITPKGVHHHPAGCPTTPPSKVKSSKVNEVKEVNKKVDLSIFPNIGKKMQDG